MTNVRVSLSQTNEQKELLALYEDAIPHFEQVEGRRPLKPLADIRELIGNPPPDQDVACYTIYFDQRIAGYAWILLKPDLYYYILHFYVGNQFRRQKVGQGAVQAFDVLFKQKGIHRSELMVSGANYLGLVFWTSVGYNQIIYVEAPEENSLTSSVELELAREF